MREEVGGSAPWIELLRSHGRGAGAHAPGCPSSSGVPVAVQDTSIERVGTARLIAGVGCRAGAEDRLVHGSVVRPVEGRPRVVPRHCRRRRVGEGPATVGDGPIVSRKSVGGHIDDGVSHLRGRAAETAAVACASVPGPVRVRTASVGCRDPGSQLVLGGGCHVCYTRGRRATPRVAEATAFGVDGLSRGSSSAPAMGALGGVRGARPTTHPAGRLDEQVR